MKNIVGTFVFYAVISAGTVIGWYVGDEMYWKEKNTKCYSRKIKKFITKLKRV